MARDAAWIWPLPIIPKNKYDKHMRPSSSTKETSDAMQPTVWPPAPTSAPVSHKLEGILLTRTGDDLVVEWTTNKQQAPMAIAGVVLFYIVFGMYEVYGGSWLHHLLNHPLGFWKNLSSQQIMRGVCVVLPSCFYIAWTLQRYVRAGFTAVFNRPTKTLHRATGVAAVRSIVISKGRPFGFVRYGVLPLYVLGHDRVFRSQNAFSFHRKENAEQIGREIAAFLDVPLRDFTTGEEFQEIEVDTAAQPDVP